MRIALGLEYDGAAFCGWQTQPGGCGVQDHLQQALSRFADAPMEVTAAGRTDRGVHATAQVVHFDTDARREEVSWIRGPNAHLHEGARVLWARGVAPLLLSSHRPATGTSRSIFLYARAAPHRLLPLVSRAP